MLLKNNDAGIEYLLQKPHCNDQKKNKKIAFLLHGFAQRASHMMNMVGKQISKEIPNTYVCSINGFHACKGYEGKKRYDWLRYDGYNWDKDSIQFTANKTAKILEVFIDHALEEYDLEYKDFVLVGFSQGTRVSLHTALRLKNSCAGVLGFSGALSLPEMLSKEVVSRPPVCLIHGDGDEVLPLTESVMAKKSLEEVGISVELEIIEDLGHTVNEKALNKGLEFLRKVLS